MIFVSRLISLIQEDFFMQQEVPLLRPLTEVSLFLTVVYVVITLVSDIDYNFSRELKEEQLSIKN